MMRIRVNKKSWLTAVVAGAVVTTGVVAGFLLSDQSEAEILHTDLMAFPTSPEPTNIGEFIRDPEAAKELGKALFWDMQTGSDGVVACATCHHHAYADHRDRNQFNPGPNGIFEFGAPNALMPATAIPVTSDDILGSQGVTKMDFVDIIPGSAVDNVVHVPDPVFNVGGVNVRQTTGKNTPTSIHSSFNHRNFWNGRAHNTFNGVNPLGDADQSAAGKIWKRVGRRVVPAQIQIDNASAASQAVGPPNNSAEMSAAGRTFPKLAKKMLSLRPLGKQLIHLNDSRLGSLSRFPERGLKVSYQTLIRRAFDSKWWNSRRVFSVDPNGMPIPGRLGTPVGTNEYSLSEINFSLFWGLAIAQYQSTLVANDAPLDRFLRGENDPRFGAVEHTGLTEFTGEARCNECHAGALFTEATVDSVATLGRVRPGNLRDGILAFFDTGFRNIAVRPTGEDLGVGGTTPFGAPLSFSRRELAPGTRVAVDGAFKTPGLRNIELTGPYFHNGGKRTLDQVVAFYKDRGDFRNENRNQIDLQFENIEIENQPAIVAFLKNALTDDRTRQEMAPFDHPELFISNGHKQDGSSDSIVRIPQLGAGGRPAEGLPPLTGF